MVATVKVLHGTAKSISKYFQLMKSLGSYYSTDGFSEWNGGAAKYLGLSGEVTQRQFENLLTGRGPDGQLLGRTRANAPNSKRQRVPGYDVTLSAPKSISVLWAIGDARIQQAVLDALLEAVRKSLKEMESDLKFARRGLGGKTEIDADLAIAMFLHELSRANDPQLHIHCIIANLCFGADKQWSAVNSRKLHEWTMALGGIFRSHLYRGLEQRLNVSYRDIIRPDGSIADWKEVALIPQSLIDHCSKRRAEIEATSGKDQLGDSAARQRANFATRPAKNEPTDRNALRDQWRLEAKDHGIDWEQLSDSLADQTVNPYIRELREDNGHQIADIPSIDEGPEERELPIIQEPTPEKSKLETDLSSPYSEQDRVATEAVEELSVEEPYVEETSEPAQVEPAEAVVEKPACENFNPKPDKDFPNAPDAPNPILAPRRPTEAPQPKQETPVPNPKQEQLRVVKKPAATGSVVRHHRELTKKEQAIYKKRFSETAQKLAEKKPTTQPASLWRHLESS